MGGQLRTHIVPGLAVNPGLSTESCAPPEQRGNCSELNKGTWAVTCPALSSGLFVCYRCVCLYLSTLKTERQLPRHPVQSLLPFNSPWREGVESLAALSGSHRRPLSAISPPGHLRGVEGGGGEGASGCACCEIRAASAPRGSAELHYSNNGAALMRFLGGLKAMMSCMVHAKLSANVSNY